MSDLVSLKPSEMVEGGAVPVDRNLRVKEARFALFDYGGKAKTTTAARLTLLDDDGAEYAQYWSAADPTKFVPTQDGKGLMRVGTAENLNKNSNFAILMQNFVSSGFPENRIGNDLSMLDDTYAYWIGLPAPKRTGIQQDADSKFEKIILVPSTIHSLPGEKGKGKVAAKPAAGKAKATATAAAGGGDVVSKAIEFVGGVVDEVGSVTRQDLALRVFKDLAKDPMRDQIATTIFSPAFHVQLLANGFAVDGESISRAG